MDATGHVPAGDQVRKTAEWLWPASATVDEEPDVAQTANSKRISATKLI
jgi:hypothetical protein